MSGSEALGSSRRTGPPVASEPAEPPDLRLVGPALTAWAGAAAGVRLPLVLTASLAVVLAVTGVPAVVRGRTTLVRGAALCAVVGAVALAVGGLRLAPVRSGPVVRLAQESASASAELVVTGDPVRHAGRTHGQQRSADLVVVPARVERVVSRGRVAVVRLPLTVLATGPGWEALLPGTRVAADGRLGTPQRGEPVAGVLSVHTAPRVLRGPGAAQRAAGRLRAGLRRAVEGLPAPERGLVPGLVDGDTSQLPDDVAQDFTTAGLTHLTAVSGANVAFVVGAALLLARRLRVRGAALPLVGLLALAGFVELARPQPSVLRAAVMGVVALVALASGRARSGIPALACAVLVLVLLDPWQSVSFGFALSVVATAALLVVAPPVTDALTRRRVPLPVAAALAVPVAAALLTAPITVLLSGGVSLASVPANLLVAPAVAPATLLGVAAAVVSVPLPPVAAVLGSLAGVPAAEIVTVARVAASVPGGTIAWAPTAAGAAVLALLLLAGVLVLPAVLSRRLPRAVAVAGACALLAQPVVAPHWPPGDWLLVACDVGQGDALVLRGDRSGAVVVDAGPDPRAVDACLRDLGVRRVAEVVLTHFHADHVEGLPGVLRHRSVAEVTVTTLPDPSAEVARVRGWARAAGVPLRTVQVGEVRSVGGARWRVLAPLHAAAEAGPNNASIVLLVQVAGLRVLLTGDVEPPAQQALMARAAETLGGPVDVLKVPHHGSANQDPAFLSYLHPRISLVSVGLGNDYGHPAPATVASLTRLGSLVGRTDRDGDLAVVVRHGSPALVRRGT
ncbi:competence protein ComEC [Motilibacter peucedani]|uniref:Competence protein ComEC n=1 Tax=Motilibacter peucedani TaxID=598650 RepID=A0A420XNW6_9ACTN|nr:DNA internalization-related competence protein ComEC/Rec2 [Motilibacter peucedani]RKS73877.1 competence protein ComEC [Motilibacter peucedani]